MFCEAFPLDHSKIDPQFVRSAVTLHYLPLAVCQFNVEGELTYQNPEANSTFGSAQYLENIEEHSPLFPITGNGEAAITSYNAHNPPGSNPASDNLKNHQTTILNITTDTVTKGEDSKADDATIPKINHFLKRFVDRQKGTQIFEDIKNGKDVNVEALVHTKRGKEWNAIHARLGRDSVTADPIILFSARDISDIVNAKKETQVNKERAEFFAILAHEIRTPLFQVTGFIDLLDQTDLTDDQAGYVKMLKTSAMSMMTVINDVLDFSKLEAGKLKLDNVPFEPKAVVDGTLAAVQQSVEEKGLCLTHSFPKGVPVKLMGDPNRLRQILLNLLNNAVKFTHHGHISAKIEMLEEDELGRVLLRFSVTDTGIGIDSHNLSNIFRKYNQAAPAIANFYGGTGLGLSISKSLVSGMGGTIGVDSEVGKGSKFWFQIPFHRPKVTPRIQKEPTTSNEAVSNLRILVAEDNGVSQKLISKMLSRLGHNATIVENGELAVKEVQGNNFDLILMDIQMPVMDGIDATKEIRSLGMKLPIVGLSASVRREDFLDIGLNDWISKPVRLKELQTKITEVLLQQKETTNSS